jgi:hypothetical protein
MADQFELGRHEAQIESLVKDMGDMKTDVAWIKETLAKREGERLVERRVALWVASAGGAGIVSVLSIVLKKFGLAP